MPRAGGLFFMPHGGGMGLADTAIGASGSSLESVTVMLRRSHGEFRVRRVIFSASGLDRRVRG